MELVADASVLVLAVADASKRGGQALERLRTAKVHAPHLADVEVGSALRRMVLQSRLTVTTARELGRRAASLIDERYPHVSGLRDWAWVNYSVLTFYDAQYAALSAILDCPLLTADTRIGRAPLRGLRVEVC